MSIKLLDWQKEVVYGNQRSLAVPAGARVGKNVATVFAMQEMPTLTVVPSMSQARCLQMDCKYLGNNPGRWSDFVTIFDSLAMRSDIEVYRQIIFNELYGVDLLTLLQLRDRYSGRIVVMGTPLGIPCPIFYPLSKMREWKFLDINQYGVGVNRHGIERLRDKGVSGRINIDGAFV